MKTVDDRQQIAGFVTIIPKEESDYDRMIRKKQEAQLDGCCEGYSPYDHYGYKPRPNTTSQDSPDNSESAHGQQDAPQTEKKANKR